MNRTLYALLLAPALASAACAVGEVGPQPTSDVGTAEAPMIINDAMMGTFTATEMRVGQLAQLVLKTDGTYHTGQVVACLIGPCPPVTQDGAYRLEIRSGATYLALLGADNQIDARYQYVLTGDTLRLRSVYPRTKSETWLTMARAEQAWCDVDKDCATQNLPTGPCASEWMCGENNACVYECAPIACAGALPNGS